MSHETRIRKLEHIRTCLEKDVEAKNITTGLEHVHLIHRAIPRVSFQDIELSVKVFGYEFSAPIIVSALTGGAEEGKRINAVLAEAVEELGLGMGVGSQRAALEDPRLEETFRIARKKAPTAFLIANIGYTQLVEDYDVADVRKAVEMIEADALAIHLNPLQEVIQAEGRPGGPGLLNAIKTLSEELDIPIIVKETGCGIASEDARKLEKVGVDGIDVAGAGGTSWAAVEHYRALESGDLAKAELGSQFWDWGIPTAVSIVEVAMSTDLTVIASGGIRTGLDAAKALSLGAHMVGVALPMLKAAVKGVEQAKLVLKQLINGLKTAMFLVGAGNVDELHKVALIIDGPVYQWLRARGYHPECYAMRGL